MKDMSRYAPLILGALALLACFLPLGPRGNLFALPDAYAQATSVMGFLGGPPRPGQAADPTAAVWIARLVYLAPIAALVLIIMSLRGAPGRGLQLVAGIIWFAAAVPVPYLAAQAFLDANPFLRGFQQIAGGSGSSNLGAGGWLLILAAIGAVVSAFSRRKERAVAPAA